MTDIERFMAKVSPEPNSGCWLWTGARTGKGYGCFFCGTAKKLIRAHRWIFQAINGDIPVELIVRHKCDVKFCVNPQHLHLGTISDNAKDCVKSGTHPIAKKTHCRNGHPYQPWNIAFRSQPNIRVCLICQKANHQRNREKNSCKKN